ncbi:unnamed protein product [Symbiodinium natans]|uniref:Uncharacterized protein n=1 Tax=Symbiodinium natans TaxID=878477 RepID=A0A812PC83_9DINO|nr:unnamed protein product [Symbiodinium natans]
MAEGRGGKGRKCKGRDASRGRRIACVEEELRAIQANPAMEELFSFYLGGGGATEKLLESYLGNGGEIQKLFESYLGTNDNSGVLLETNYAEVIAGLHQSFLEMQGLAQTSAALSPTAAAATRRSLEAFISRRSINGGNHSRRNSSHLKAGLDNLVGEVSLLHTHMSRSHSLQLSNSEVVAQKAAEYAREMNRVWKSKAHILGLHRHATARSKRRQTWIREHAMKAKRSLMASDFREEAQRTAIVGLDKTWWEIRAQLDKYFEAMDKHSTTYKAVLVALDDYTSRCSIAFPELKHAYMNFVQVNNEAESVLKASWTAVNPLVGFLASQVVDGQLLQMSTLHDIQALSSNASALFQNSSKKWSELCAQPEKAKKLALEAVHNALDDGLFGEMVHQLDTVFLELRMMEQRFQEARLDTPSNQDVLSDAKLRLEEAVQEELDGMPMESEFLWQQWHKQACEV